VTSTEQAGEGARAGERDSSEFINDLHVWFRSFRVKLSHLGVVCAQFKENSSAVTLKIKRNREASNLLHQLSENLARIDFEHARQVDEFDHIDASFTDFDARDDGLRGLEPHGDLMLREFPAFAGRDQGGAQRAVTTTAKGLQILCSQL
jgi:hypothetical protein